MNRTLLPAAACAAALFLGAATARAQDNPTTRILFGDLHVHTTYSPDTKTGFGTGPLKDPGYACRAARAQGLDFVAITDHDFGLTASNWTDTQTLVNAQYQPGQFTTFLGYEWTSTSSYVYQKDTGAREVYLEGYGHRCVIFRTADVPGEVFRYTDPRYDTPEELWGALAAWKAGAAGRDALTIPHTPMEDVITEVTDNRERHLDSTVDWSHVNAEFQRLVEVFSKHGSSEGFDGVDPATVSAQMAVLQDPASTPQQRQEVLQRFYLPVHSYATWPQHSVQYALGLWRGAPPADREKYRLGLIADTDDHQAAPGSVAETDTTIVWQANGGVVAVHATDNTREAIFEALRARRVYATSGPRIRLWLDASTDRGSCTMGGSVTAGAAPTLVMRAIPDGAPRIEAFEIVKDGRLVATVAPTAALNAFSATWTDPQFTGDACYYVRALQGATTTYYSVNFGSNQHLEPYSLRERAWSSPVWVEKAQ